MSATTTRHPLAQPADPVLAVYAARSHKLEGPDHPLQTWPAEMRNQFHPDAVAAQGTAGSVLIFDCRLMVRNFDWNLGKFDGYFAVFWHI